MKEISAEDCVPSAETENAVNAVAAKARYAELHDLGEAHFEEIEAIAGQIEAIFPGREITLIVRDPAVPVKFGICQTVFSKDDIRKVALGFVQNFAGFKKRSTGEEKGFAS